MAALFRVEARIDCPWKLPNRVVDGGVSWGRPSSPEAYFQFPEIYFKEPELKIPARRHEMGPNSVETFKNLCPDSGIVKTWKTAPLC